VGRPDPLANPAPLIRRVYAYAAYRIGDGPDAEDVTSETFERAVRYRDSFDPSRGSPATWLLGIARRCVDDALRRRATVPLVAPDDAPSAAGGFEESVVDRLSLISALEQLDERSRDLIALRYGADLKAREIGELLGLRANAVDVALHRTMRRLRDNLGREIVEPRPVTEEPARLLP
jgi:RNA polymerase sigma factor (sigma-70 family)